MHTVGVGKRAVAVILDSILMFAAAYAIAVATGSTTEEGFQMSGAPVFGLFFLSIAYYVVLEATLGGTLGKKILGIKIVKQDGTPMDWQASIIRNALRIVDGIFVYLVGAIVIWTSKDKQRLGDKVARTLVVDAKA
jgi:uncharacterized RDD family membrane protein YckC